MKNKYLFLLIFLLAKTGWAQTNDPHSTVYDIYTQNRFLYNPAYAGDFGQAFADGILRYNGVEGAPKAFTAGINSPIGTQKTSGLGLLLQHSTKSNLQGTNVTLNYSYLVKLNETNNLSFGLGAGVVDRRLDKGGVTIADETALLAADYGVTRLGMRFGMKYNWNKKLDISFALPEIFSDNYDFQKHFQAMASYKLYAVREKLEIEPSIMFQNYSPKYAANQTDFNVYGCWDQTFWLQGGYRMNFGTTPVGKSSAYIISAGVYFYNLGLSYAYEGGIGNDVSSFSERTHEIQLTYYFDKDRKKNNNKDLLNNNQLEMLQDSAKQDMGEQNQKQIDSLKAELERLKLAQKLQGVAEYFDSIMNKIKEKEKKVIETKEKMKEWTIVFFDVNKYNIKDEYYVKLDEMAEEIKTKNLKVKVLGYADETGPERHNQILSEKRANEVHEYLLRKGCSKDAFIVVGKGETTQFGPSLQQNRRVECEIVK